MSDPPSNDAQHESVGAAISNLTVRLVKDYTGRGPTTARTFFNENLITVVLRDTLTPGEKTLVAHGEADRVIETRLIFQRTMQSELAAGVAEISGRSIVAFMSANHIDPDMAIESFVLAPAS